MITNIPITKLIPHPNNPRQDLGDLTELAASITESGILQNLTVVPAIITEDVPGEYGSTATERTNAYMVIIGHRRMAAAKLAGLTEVPCAVVEMDVKTQVATMLLENMQRADLTVYEQAQGMQMMLDLGDNVNSIAAKTGFSETTIRRRVKLLNLDSDKFKEAEARGATLEDYAKLDEIKDLELKNQVLESIGTNSFGWKLNSAKREEKEAAMLAGIIEQLKTFAIEVDDEEGRERIRAYNAWDYDNFKVPHNTDTSQYYYKVKGTSVILLTDKREADALTELSPEELQKQAAEEARRAKVASLNIVSKQAYKARMEFIRNVYIDGAIARKLDKIAALFMVMGDDPTLTRDVFAEFFGIADGLKPRYPVDESDARETYLEACERIFARGEFNDSHVDKVFWQNQWKHSSHILLSALYLSMEDTDHRYHCAYYGKHQEDEELDRLYEALCAFGYEMSDDEKALQDGTHELYGPVDSEEGRA